MGDPKKFRKKYSTPNHPWQKVRIDEEKVLMQEYGFKNKTELWKLNSKLRNYKYRVKQLVPKKDELSEKEKKDLLGRLLRLNLIKENAITEDILAVTLKDICERRLQTLVMKKDLAKSIKQSRKFIVHGHIMIGDKKLTSPSYLVSSLEEAMVRFADNSSLASESHPERKPIMKAIKAEMAAAGLSEKHEDKKNTKKSEIDEMKVEIGREAKELKVEEEQ